MTWIQSLTGRRAIVAAVMAKRKNNVKVVLRVEFKVVLDEAEKHRDRPPSWFYLRTERAGDRIKSFLTAANLLEHELNDPTIKIRKIVATHEVVPE